MAEGKRKRPAWTRDETLLACALVVQNDWRPLTPNDQKVIDLSKLLQRMSIHPPEVRGERFRNPNSVARKMCDLATNHDGCRGVRTRSGKIELGVVRTFEAPGADPTLDDEKIERARPGQERVANKAGEFDVAKTNGARGGTSPNPTTARSSTAQYRLKRT